MSYLTNYRIMLYTRRVKCFDGVTRTTRCTADFTDTTVLRHRLAAWNGQPGPAGEPYQYFETPDQAFHNDGACCIPTSSLPGWNCLWNGRQAHNYEWRELAA